MDYRGQRSEIQRKIEELKAKLDTLSMAQSAGSYDYPTEILRAKAKEEFYQRLDQDFYKNRFPVALDTLASTVIQINEFNGWSITRAEDWTYSKYKIPAILALVGTEVSEAVEAYRKGDRENFLEECADVVIRVLDLVGGLGDAHNLGLAIQKKLVKNVGRGYRHGNKVV